MWLSKSKAVLGKGIGKMIVSICRLNSANEEEDPEMSVSMTLQDEILRLAKIKTSAKIK